GRYMNHSSQMRYHTYTPAEALTVLGQEPHLNMIMTALTSSHHSECMLLPEEPLHLDMQTYLQAICSYRAQRIQESCSVPVVVLANIDYSFEQQKYVCQSLRDVAHQCQPEVVMMSSLSVVPTALRSLLQDGFMRLLVDPRAYADRPKIILRKSERLVDNGGVKASGSSLHHSLATRVTAVPWVLSLDDFLAQELLAR
ncbi:MAG: hypothetical protein AABX37_05915, partial [Nanoarchaeota archaeon]